MASLIPTESSRLSLPENSSLLAGASDYVDAAAVAATDWVSDRVVAIRVDLSLEGADAVGVDGKPLQRNVQLVVTIRNHAQ